MKIAPIMPIKRPSMLRCSSCHAEVEAACECRVPYVPAGELAAEMAEAHPEMSTRAIAKELGVHHTTVMKARSGGGIPPPASGARVKGLDGKSYAQRRILDDSDVPSGLEEKAEAINRRRVFMKCAEDTIRKAEQGAGLVFAKKSEIDDEVLAALDRIIEAWISLRDEILNRKKGK